MEKKRWKIKGTGIIQPGEEKIEGQTIAGFQVYEGFGTERMVTSCSPHTLRIEWEEMSLNWSMREHFLAGTVVKVESLIKKYDTFSFFEDF